MVGLSLLYVGGSDMRGRACLKYISSWGLHLNKNSDSAQKMDLNVLHKINGARPVRDLGGKKGLGGGRVLLV